MTKGRHYEYLHIDRAKESQDDWYLQRRKEIGEEDFVQTQLEVSQPGDAHETEADNIAQLVVQGNKHSGSFTPTGGSKALQRKINADWTPEGVQFVTFLIVKDDPIIKSVYSMIHAIDEDTLMKFISPKGPFRPEVKAKEHRNAGSTPINLESKKDRQRINLNPAFKFDEAVITYMHELNHYIDAWMAGAAGQKNDLDRQRDENGEGVGNIWPEGFDLPLPFLVKPSAQRSALGELLTFANQDMIDKMDEDILPTDTRRQKILKRKYKRWNWWGKRKGIDWFTKKQQKWLDKEARNAYLMYNIEIQDDHEINTDFVELGYVFEKSLYFTDRANSGAGENWPALYNDWFKQKYRKYLDFPAFLKALTSIHLKGDGSGEQGTHDPEQFQSLLSSTKGRGSSLDDCARGEMESALSTDLSSVRIHTGSAANALSESVNAKAFTHGNDIYFRNGNYNPSSGSGKELLAHELVHTQQQAGGASSKIQRTKEDVDEVAERIRKLLGFAAISNPTFVNGKAKQAIKAYRLVQMFTPEDRSDFQLRYPGLNAEMLENLPAEFTTSNAFGMQAGVSNDEKEKILDMLRDSSTWEKDNEAQLELLLELVIEAFKEVSGPVETNEELGEKTFVTIKSSVSKLLSEKYTNNELSPENIKVLQGYEFTAPYFSPSWNYMPEKVTENSLGRIMKRFLFGMKKRKAITSKKGVVRSEWWKFLGVQTKKTAVLEGFSLVDFQKSIGGSIGGMVFTDDNKTEDEVRSDGDKGRITIKADFGKGTAELTAPDLPYASLNYQGADYTTKSGNGEFKNITASISWPASKRKQDEVDGLVHLGMGRLEINNLLFLNPEDSYAIGKIVVENLFLDLHQNFGPAKSFDSLSGLSYKLTSIIADSTSMIMFAISSSMNRFVAPVSTDDAKAREKYQENIKAFLQEKFTSDFSLNISFGAIQIDNLIYIDKDNVKNDLGQLINQKEPPKASGIKQIKIGTLSTDADFSTAPKTPLSSFSVSNTNPVPEDIQVAVNAKKRELMSEKSDLADLERKYNYKTLTGVRQKRLDSLFGKINDKTTLIRNLEEEIQKLQGDLKFDFTSDIYDISLQGGEMLEELGRPLVDDYSLTSNGFSETTVGHLGYKTTFSSKGISGTSLSFDNVVIPRLELKGLHYETPDHDFVLGGEQALFTGIDASMDIAFKDQIPDLYLKIKELEKELFEAEMAHVILMGQAKDVNAITISYHALLAKRHVVDELKVQQDKAYDDMLSSIVLRSVKINSGQFDKLWLAVKSSGTKVNFPETPPVSFKGLELTNFMFKWDQNAEVTATQFGDVASVKLEQLFVPAESNLKEHAQGTSGLLMALLMNPLQGDGISLDWMKSGDISYKVTSLDGLASIYKADKLDGKKTDDDSPKRRFVSPVVELDKAAITGLYHRISDTEVQHKLSVGNIAVNTFFYSDDKVRIRSNEPVVFAPITFDLRLISTITQGTNEKKLDSIMLEALDIDKISGSRLTVEKFSEGEWKPLLDIQESDPFSLNYISLKHLGYSLSKKKILIDQKTVIDMGRANAPAIDSEKLTLQLTDKMQTEWNNLSVGTISFRGGDKSSVLRLNKISIDDIDSPQINISSPAFLLKTKGSQKATLKGIKADIEITFKSDNLDFERIDLVSLHLDEISGYGFHVVKDPGKKDELVILDQDPLFKTSIFNIDVKNLGLVFKDGEFDKVDYSKLKASTGKINLPHVKSGVLKQLIKPIGVQAESMTFNGSDTGLSMTVTKPSAELYKSNWFSMGTNKEALLLKEIDEAANFIEIDKVGFTFNNDGSFTGFIDEPKLTNLTIRVKPGLEMDVEAYVDGRVNISTGRELFETIAPEDELNDKLVDSKKKKAVILDTADPIRISKFTLRKTTSTETTDEKRIRNVDPRIVEGDYDAWLEGIEKTARMLYHLKNFRTDIFDFLDTTNGMITLKLFDQPIELEVTDGAIDINHLVPKIQPVLVDHIRQQPESVIGTTMRDVATRIQIALDLAPAWLILWKVPWWVNGLIHAVAGGYGISFIANLLDNILTDHTYIGNTDPVSIGAFGISHTGDVDESTDLFKHDLMRRDDYDVITGAGKLSGLVAYQIEQAKMGGEKPILSAAELRRLQWEQDIKKLTYDELSDRALDTLIHNGLLYVADPLKNLLVTWLSSFFGQYLVSNLTFEVDLQGITLNQDFMKGINDLLKPKGGDSIAQGQYDPLASTMGNLKIEESTAEHIKIGASVIPGFTYFNGPKTLKAVLGTTVIERASIDLNEGLTTADVDAHINGFRLAIQRKGIEIGSTNDPLEHEADSIASKVANGQNADLSSLQRFFHGVQRKEKEEEAPLDLVDSLDSTTGGTSMDDSTRNEMESKMGVDFGGVKIHTDANAHSMNEQVNAKAFTYGQNIFFRNGNYYPNSKAGKELLAHELVHTVQQSGNIQKKIQRDEFEVQDPSKKEGFVKVEPQNNTMVDQKGVSMHVNDSDQSRQVTLVNPMDLVHVQWKSDRWAYCKVNDSDPQYGYIRLFHLIAYRNEDRLADPIKVKWGNEPFTITMTAKREGGQKFVGFKVEYTGGRQCYGSLYTHKKTEGESFMRWDDYFTTVQCTANPTHLNSELWEQGVSFARFDLFKELTFYEKLFATISHKSTAGGDEEHKDYIEHQFKIARSSDLSPNSWSAETSALKFNIQVPDFKTQSSKYIEESNQKDVQYNQPVQNELPSDYILKSVSLAVTLPGERVLDEDFESSIETLDSTVVQITLSEQSLSMKMSPQLYLRLTNFRGFLADNFNWTFVEYDFNLKKVNRVDLEGGLGTEIGMEAVNEAIVNYIENNLLVGTRIAEDENYNPFTEPDLMSTLFQISDNITGEEETTDDPLPLEPFEMTNTTLAATVQPVAQLQYLDESKTGSIMEPKPMTISALFNGSFQDMLNVVKPYNSLTINTVTLINEPGAFRVFSKNEETLDIRQITIHNGGLVTLDQYDSVGKTKESVEAEKLIRTGIAIFQLLPALRQGYTPSGPRTQPSLLGSTLEVIVEEKLRIQITDLLYEYRAVFSNMMGSDYTETTRQNLDLIKLLNIEQ